MCCLHLKCAINRTIVSEKSFLITCVWHKGLHVTDVFVFSCSLCKCFIYMYTSYRFNAMSILWIDLQISLGIDILPKKPRNRHVWVKVVVVMVGPFCCGPNHVPGGCIMLMLCTLVGDVVEDEQIEHLNVFFWNEVKTWILRRVDTLDTCF